MCCIDKTDLNVNNKTTKYLENEVLDLRLGSLAYKKGHN